MLGYTLDIFDSIAEPFKLRFRRVYRFQTAPAKRGHHAANRSGDTHDRRGDIFGHSVANAGDAPADVADGLAGSFHLPAECIGFAFDVAKGFFQP